MIDIFAATLPIAKLLNDTLGGGEEVIASGR